MITFVSSLIATFVTVPLIMLILFFFISFKVTKNKKKSFHHMIDYSTVFFILGVYTLCFVIWERSFLFPILLLMVIVAMVFVVVQWKLNEEVKIQKTLKGFWRFTFLLFFSGYFSLLFYGLFARIIQM